MFSFFILLSFGFCRHSPPLVLRFYDSAYRYRLGSILYGCSRSNPDLRLMGSRNDAIPRRLHRTVRRRSQLEVAPSTEKSHRPPLASTLTELTHYANPANPGTLANAYT
jgi:hypothetical protein